MFLGLALSVLPMAAEAHNVIASVFPAGRQIEGEIGFSDGQMAAGALVEVFDADGNRLAEVTTDEEGFFLYTPTAPVIHVFRSDLGAGHLALMSMPAHEVATIMGLSAPDPVTAEAGGAVEAQGSAVLGEAERAALAAMIRQEIRPLRQELTAYRTQNDLQTILGGIGYILGLFGLGFYLAARRKLKG
ncbi:MAG: cobalt ABC transporter permease [Roseicyclus sp.]|uniref:cobalt ABC transporter permease n=1 Tax=Roseicyclus sp. TaxID=1914329 RepID=UPI003A8363F7